MNETLFTVLGHSIQALEGGKEATTSNLESHKIVYLPEMRFSLNKSEEILYDAIKLDNKHKNISFNPHNNKLGGLSPTCSQDLKILMEQLMYRFAHFAKEFIYFLMPAYDGYLEWGRTSYRPAQISGRISSKRKDDTRLHVDAFPASPVQGKRILRIFSNINPYGEPRIWQTGEPFEKVLSHFLPRAKKYNRVFAQLLKSIKATKSLRTSYDHYMLSIHDAMKLDDVYQKEVQKETIQFPANSTWVVFTDSVSHAALQGRYVLEQTFYLPNQYMLDKKKSPQHILATMLHQMNRKKDIIPI